MGVPGFTGTVHPHSSDNEHNGGYFIAWAALNLMIGRDTLPQFIQSRFKSNRGLRAFILTDAMQMVMLLSIAFVLVPWCVVEAGGMSTVLAGLGGGDGTHRSLFDAWIAFTMGIPMTLGLISGPIGDQVFFSTRDGGERGKIAKTFVLAGLLFGIVPVTLSLLGFIGASEVSRGALSVTDPQVVGPIVVAALLSKAALYGFTLMAFAGLCSTLDSSLCAISSPGSIDIDRQYFNGDSSDQATAKAARLSLIGLTVLGTSVALCQPKPLWWCFLAYWCAGIVCSFPDKEKISSGRSILGSCSFAGDRHSPFDLRKHCRQSALDCLGSSSPCSNWTHRMRSFRSDVQRT